MKNTIESQNGNLLFLFASFYKILRCYLQLYSLYILHCIIINSWFYSIKQLWPYVRETFKSKNWYVVFSRWPFIGSNHNVISKTLTITFTNCQVYEYLNENTSILKWNSIPIIRSCFNSAKNQTYYHSNRQITDVFVVVLLCFVQFRFFL